MGQIARLLLGALFLMAASGCTVGGTINRLTSAEDRAFAQSFVEDVRSGDAPRLRAQFDPELWVQSADQLRTARTLYPAGAGETKLIGFEVSTNVDGAGARTEKAFTLVTTDGSHWTQTEVKTLAENGPAQVVGWNVEGFDHPPPELRTYELLETMLPILQVGGAVLLLALAILVFWLVRRSRRRSPQG